MEENREGNVKPEPTLHHSVSELNNKKVLSDYPHFREFNALVFFLALFLEVKAF